MTTRALGVLVIASTLALACGPREARPIEKEDHVAAVHAFDDWAIMWLGESYDSDDDGVGDMPLTDAQGLFSPARYVDGRLIKPEVHRFSLGYGTCDLPDGDEPRCAIPLSLTFAAPCSRPRFALAEREHMIRGVPALIAAHAISLETADFSLTINGESATLDQSLDDAIRIVEQLQPANAKAAHLSGGRDLLPQNCPPGD